MTTPINAQNVIFSIVIPTKNRPALLAESVQSVLRQTISEWELIIVDDGGEMQLEIPRDSRIHVMTTATNLGPAGARNVGLAAAKGRFVAFLDDDDAWTPTRLEHALEGHRLKELVVCGEGHLGKIAPTKSFGRVRLHCNLSFILNGTTPHLGRTSVAREKCPQFDERLAAAEDVDWWFRVVDELEGLALVPAADWLWRRHEGMRHGIGQEARLRAQFQLVDRHHDYLIRHPRALAFRLLRMAQLSRRQGKPRDGLRLAFRSFLRFPSPRAALELARCARKLAFATPILKGGR